MLSEEEKQELKDMAASARIREEFSLLDAASRAAQAKVTPDQYVKFLSTMFRLTTPPPVKRPFVPYRTVRL